MGAGLALHECSSCLRSIGGFACAGLALFSGVLLGGMLSSVLSRYLSTYWLRLWGNSSNAPREHSSQFRLHGMEVVIPLKKGLDPLDPWPKGAKACWLILSRERRGVLGIHRLIPNHTHSPIPRLSHQQASGASGPDPQVPVAFTSPCFQLRFFLASRPLPILQTALPERARRTRTPTASSTAAPRRAPQGGSSSSSPSAPSAASAPSACESPSGWSPWRRSARSRRWKPRTRKASASAGDAKQLSCFVIVQGKQGTRAFSVFYFYFITFFCKEQRPRTGFRRKYPPSLLTKPCKALVWNHFSEGTVLVQGQSVF